MLAFICYLLAVIFGLLAVLGPSHPSLDRARMLAAAFTAFAVPFMVAAAKGL